MALFIDDKKVSVKELCAELGIQEKDIPYKRRNKDFEQNMPRNLDGTAKRDTSTGRYLCTRKVSGTPCFSVFVPFIGYEVKIRYAVTQRKVKDGEFDYQPKLIDMLPGEDGVASMDDVIQFIFWFLHPWNLHSPFHVKGTTHYFEYKDEDLQSKTSNDHEEAMINALGYIVGQYAKPIIELRSLAKGLNFTAVDEKTDEVLKKELRDYARRDPALFLQQIDSREISFSGVIQDAIDKKVLTTKTINGMIRWYLNDKEILPVTFGMDPVTVLKNEMADKWYLYSKEVEGAIEGVDLKAKLNKPENDPAFENKDIYEIKQSAELTSEQLSILKQMKEDSAFDEKIKKLAAVDPDDPNLHHMILASYKKNIDAVNAYKASLVPAVPDSVEV